MNLYHILTNILNIDLSRFTNSDIENVLTEIESEELEKAIDSWIHSERDRIILKKRLIDGYTFQQICDYLYAEHKIQLSVRQMSNIIPKLENKLFKHI